MKIYTKTGDKGTTSLVGGARVPKTHPRLEAYGTVDELTAQVAFLRDNFWENETIGQAEKNGLNDELIWILERLMVVSASLAADEHTVKKIPRISLRDVERLEEAIDCMQDMAPKVFRFTLPGGHPLVSQSHICRTVCRRAERAALRICETERVPVEDLCFLNRLSDYFYAFGRELARLLKVEEKLWEP